MSLAQKLKQELEIDAVLTKGGGGQFDVLADGEKVASRESSLLKRVLGGGFPDEAAVVATLEKRLAKKRE